MRSYSHIRFRAPAQHPIICPTFVIFAIKWRKIQLCDRSGRQETSRLGAARRRRPEEASTGKDAATRNCEVETIGIERRSTDRRQQRNNAVRYLRRKPSDRLAAKQEANRPPDSPPLLRRQAGARRVQPPHRREAGSFCGVRGIRPNSPARWKPPHLGTTKGRRRPRAAHALRQLLPSRPQHQQAPPASTTRETQVGATRQRHATPTPPPTSTASAGLQPPSSLSQPSLVS